VSPPETVGKFSPSFKPADLNFPASKPANRFDTKNGKNIFNSVTEFGISLQMVVMQKMERKLFGENSIGEKW
jgi:hypothetical protein